MSPEGTKPQEAVYGDDYKPNPGGKVDKEPFSIEVRRGGKTFSCNLCIFDTLSVTEMDTHQKYTHPLPEVDKLNTDLVNIDEKKDSRMDKPGLLNLPEDQQHELFEKAADESAKVQAAQMDKLDFVKEILRYNEMVSTPVFPKENYAWKATANKQKLIDAQNYLYSAHQRSVNEAEQRGYARAANTYMLSGEKERINEAVRAELDSMENWFIGIPDTEETKRLYGWLQTRKAELESQQ